MNIYFRILIVTLFVIFGCYEASAQDSMQVDTNSWELAISWEDGLTSEQKDIIINEYEGILLKRFSIVPADVVLFFPSEPIEDLKNRMEKNKKIESVYLESQTKEFQISPPESRTVRKVNNLSNRNINYSQYNESATGNSSSYTKMFPYRGWRFYNRIHESQDYFEQKDEVLVAVFTDGTEITNSELVGAIYENPKEKNGQPGVDDDGNGYVDDIKGVDISGLDLNFDVDRRLGIVIAAANYSENELFDRSGKVKVLPISVYGHGRNECNYHTYTSTTEWMLEAIEYSKSMGAKIIILPSSIADNKLVVDALKRFPGIIVTCPDHSDLCFDDPDSLLLKGEMSNRIVVGFQEHEGRYYIWYGGEPDISAIGRLTTIYGNNQAGISESTINSAGLVTGIVADLFSSYPELSAGEIKKILLSSSDKNQWHIKMTKTAGNMNAGKAMLGRSVGGAFYIGDWARIKRDGPSARTGFQLAYNDDKGLLYLYGGNTINGDEDLFWIWDGKNWSEIKNRKNAEWPSPGIENQMIYRNMEKDLFLFDFTARRYWSWEQNKWNHFEVNLPPDVRIEPGIRAGDIVYNKKKKNTVFHGNFKRKDTYEVGTFTLSNSKWSEVFQPKNKPQASSSLAYDSANGKIVMSNIESDWMSSAKLWFFNGKKWRKKKHHVLPGREGKLVYSPIDNSYLRFGSVYSKDPWSYIDRERGFDIWKFKNNKWTNLGYDMHYLAEDYQCEWMGDKLILVGQTGNWVGLTVGEQKLSVWQYSGAIKPTWIDILPLNQSDYTGDGKADFVLYIPGDKSRFEIKDGKSEEVGSWGDIPVPGDYSGDGEIDYAVCQRLNKKKRWDVGKLVWKFKNNKVVFGQFDDIPVPLDYDNDGKTDIAVFRKDTATWYFKGKRKVEFGNPADLPVPADYNGDGRPELATYTPLTSTWHIQGVGDFKFGKPGDSPVPADYDGDGRKDIATWNPRKRLWTVMEWGSGKTLIKERFGEKWDIPVPGDYNGDGKAQLATYTPMKALWNIKGKPSVKFGSPGDVPLVRGN